MMQSTQHSSNLHSRKIIESDSEITAFLKHLESRMPGESAEVRASVQETIAAVKEHGTRAVLELRLRFENVSMEEPLLFDLQNDRSLSQNFFELSSKCAPSVRAAIEASIQRVRAYHEIQQDSDRTLTETSQQANKVLGQFTSRVQALDRVAVYVPGGKAFYPSSVIMSVVPAQVAGVKRICLVTPFRSLENETFAATVLALGITEILATGGAQGVAAAAFGIEATASNVNSRAFERCDKIVGPGNAYVATAKHLLSGRIGIDSFAGPSEILILSDGSSPPEWIVADLLAQAEHDEEASSVLVTTSMEEAKRVVDAMDGSLKGLKDRQDVARRSWNKYGAVIVVSDRAKLVQIANQLNAEHLHVHTQCALTEEGRVFWTSALRGVGAIFLGRYTAEVFGDYIAGPSHVLPTAGTARFASPLGVYDFIRRSSVLWMTPALAGQLAGPTQEFATAEELWGHAHSASLRASTGNRNDQ